MFYKSVVLTFENKQYLYLYIDFNFEVSKDLFLKNGNISLTNKIKNYISKNNINFNGSIVYLVVDNYVIGKINLYDKLNNYKKFLNIDEIDSINYNSSIEII
ncbi:MAG: hypothetical protein PUD59_00855 [bacterium]|nr:hypothetical protein [bacterium]